MITVFDCAIIVSWLVCVFITAVPIIKVFVWGGG